VAAAATFGITIEAHCVAAQPDCSHADLVIVDEAHHMPATTWSATIAQARGIVWGFSATPWSDPERDEQLRKFFQAFHVVNRAEVMAGGSITEGRVTIHDIDTPGELDGWIDEQTAFETARRCRRYPFIDPAEHERRARWQATAEAVRLNERRNAKIADLADAESGSVLVLVSTVEHGEELACGIWRQSQVVHAKLGKKKRREAIDAFRSGELRVMIATSLADEGLDVPRASVLILAAGGRSAGKLEQRAGRVMRPHAEKEFGTVHDFADRGAGLAHSQFWARYKTYKKLGYTITFAR
ncbi:MAG: DEAD/DEAH box helicase, partial [Steroidobacteraceae bacterium]